MKKLISAFFLVLLAGGFVSAADDFNKAGRTVLQFLKIGMGARQAGIGEACMADQNDINAVFWNPSAITAVENIQVAFNYTQWIGDLGVTAGAVGYRAGSFGVFSIHYISLDYGDIEESLVTSASGGLDTRTGETFSGDDFAIGLSFAKRFTDRLSIGISVKYLREKLFVYESEMWAFDVGSHYSTGWKGIRLAMSAQNFGNQARFLHTKEEYQQTYDLPLLFRIGASIDLMGGNDLFLGGVAEQHKLTFNIDAIHSNDYAERLHIGTEYLLYKRIAFRAGYRFNYNEGQLGLGLGINHSIDDINIQIDYGYVSYDFLTSPHRISMILSF